MTKLRVSDELELPVDVAVESTAILAKKGAGKSNAAAVMFEELQAADVPAVVVDPKGDWWGVRSSGDGKQPGLPVVVFGGKHGDVPLEPTGGALVADLILGDPDRGYLSCVLDVSQFTISEQRRFLLDFGQRLFRAKDEERVLHLVLEEAHEYLPQSVGRDAVQLVSTWQRIVKQGRFKGLGLTVVSQRSAALNKDVLTQVDSLVVLKTMSPQDRAAVKAWLDVHVGGTDVVKTLHELAPGEAWLWSPDRFPDPVRFQFRRRWTFDSGATPKVGEKRVTPRTLADVDLAAVKEAMAESIEKAKADDPKELRRRIRDLEKQLAERPAAEPERVEVPVLTGTDRALIVDFIQRWDLAYDESTNIVNTLRDALARVDAHPQTPVTVRPRGTRQPAAPRARSEPPRHSTPAETARPDGDGTLGKGERTILTAIAQYPTGVTREQLTVLTGYKRSSRDTYLQRLRQAGHVDTAGGTIRATDAGITALGDDYQPLPTGAALRDHWLGRLPEGERRILAELIDAWPQPVTRDDLSEATGYKRSSRDTYVQRLRSRQLVTTDSAGVTASDTLFDGGVP